MKLTMALLCVIVPLTACDNSQRALTLPTAPTPPNPTPAPPAPLAQYTLSGMVRSAGKVPVVGARVAALDDAMGQELPASSAATDSKGDYSIRAMPSSFGYGPLVSASKPGYFADIKWSGLIQDKQLDFELSPLTPPISLGETIHGRIGDSVCASLGYGGGSGAACQRFALQVPSSGTLEVTFAGPISNFFDVDVVKPDGTIGVYSAATSSPWRVMLPVEAGSIYTIRIASSPAREFELTTALR